MGRQLIRKNIPAWTYKGRWWQRFGWRKRRAIELLHRVGIKNHKDAMRSFPYELTEGECQKVMIAIALANQPRLLIADEPTNSMEPTTQAQIFRLLTCVSTKTAIPLFCLSAMTYKCLANGRIKLTCLLMKQWKPRRVRSW